jgi:sugar lactone lactonase YvrE
MTSAASKKQRRDFVARFGLAMAFAGFVAFAVAGPVMAAESPKFEIDASWPKPLPKNWIFGQIGGIFVDPKDNTVWITQRPRTVNDRDRRAQRGDKSICCFTAPSVVQFDQQGNVLQSWGGPETAKGFDWPQNEHGIFVDYKNNVWFGGNGENDGMVLKFTHDGKFLMMIGKSAPQTNSKDETRVGRAADMIVDPATNELYVSDGYFNHRVVVFDADTGKFKRTWGAYGKPPTDEKLTYDAKVLPQQFNNPVHGIRMTNDGKIVVSDRGNNRIQVFEKDGKFIREYPVLRDSTAPGVTGSTVFWPDKDQSYWFTSDDPNGQIHILRKSDGQVVGNFGRVGRGPGEFENLHNIAIDKDGNIYTAEVQGQRVQRFLYKGGLSPIGK